MQLGSFCRQLSKKNGEWWRNKFKGVGEIKNLACGMFILRPLGAIRAMVYACAEAGSQGQRCWHMGLGVIGTCCI